MSSEVSAPVISEDARELRRGVLITYVGYGLKIGMPVLLALATRTYGAARWGEFLAAQAVILIASRVALLGLDKGLLWSVASNGKPDALRSVRPATMWVLATSLLVTACLRYAPDLFARVPAEQVAVLRVVVLGLVPLCLSELLLNATMGQRRMELQVVVRETLNPLVQVLAALLFFRLGAHELGLAWAFVAAQGSGLVVAFFGFSRLFRDASWPRHESLLLPNKLVRYAAPLWLAETANSFALRLDTLVLSALTDPATVGIWGVVGQFANALRQMRRAYDPIVTALAARIAAHNDTRRLSETFSYASQLVQLTQLPVFALLFCTADVLMPLYGPGFERGEVPLVVLAGFFLISGGAGLAGLIVTGYGRSLLTLVNVLLGAGLQWALLFWLVPQHGLVGAAISVGAAVCAVNLVQLVQMRIVTGSFHYTQRSRFSLTVMLGSGAAMAIATLLGRQLALAPWWTRGGALLAFVVSYAFLCMLGARRGLLRAPHEDREPSPSIAPVMMEAQA